MRPSLRFIGIGAPFAIAVAASVIGAPVVKHMRDDAFIRCSVASSKTNPLILQKDGTYRSTAPSISLRWSWTRHDYLCVYHDDQGNRTIRPAPETDE